MSDDDVIKDVLYKYYLHTKKCKECNSRLLDIESCAVKNE